MQPAEISESRGQTRDININIRVKRTQRDLINHAAELLGNRGQTSYWKRRAAKLKTFC
jgi:uncharacterized protein (DUF1778 family)